ncbi:ArsR family transcriptional regulator [Thermoproteota archaeon]
MSDISSTVTDSMEETKDRHKRYLRAVNNPIRRKILRAMEKGHNTAESICIVTKLDLKTLDWHLKILIDGFCVKKENLEGIEKYILTQEGRVVDFLDK